MTLGKAPASRSNSTRPRTYNESSSSRVSSKYAPATVTTRTQGYAGVAATITSRKTSNYASLAKRPSGSTYKDAVTPAAAAAAATATATAAASSVDGFRVNHSTMYAPHRQSTMGTPTMPHGVAELGNYSTKGEANAALYGIFKQACRAEGTGRPECTLEENERGLQRCTVRDDTRRRVDLYWTSPSSERWTLVTKVEGKSAAQGSGGPNGSPSSSRELRVTPDSRSTTTAADSNIAAQSAGPIIGTTGTLVPTFLSGRQGNSVADATASLEPSQNLQGQGKRLRSASPVPAPMTSSSPPLPRPDRKSAMPIPRDTPRPQLPCVVRNALGAPPFFDPARVFTADGRSCDEGCRNELALRLCPIILGLAPVPGSRDWTQVLTDAEALEYSGQVSNSLAIRQKAAKAMMTEYVVTLVLYRGLLLASNHCVLLHGVAELSGGTAAPAFLAPPTDSGRPPKDDVAMASVEKLADADRTEETASGGAGTTAGQVPGVVEGEADQDMVNLLLHKHPNDQMNAVLLPAIKTLRNASGRATWLDFESQLRTAAELTFDLDLAEERCILDTTMFRGQRLLDAGGDPKQVLFMFTEKLPNAHGVDRAVLAQDEAALKAIVEASSRLKGAAGGGSGPAATTTHPPFSGAPPQATNGQAAYPSIDPHQGPSPHGARTHIQPVVAYGAAAAPPPLPVLPRGQGYGGRPNVNTGGRGGQHALVHPPNRDPQEINRLNRQLQELQQTFQPVKNPPGAAAAPPPPALPRGQGYGGRPNVNAGGRGGQHALVRPPNRDPQEINRLNRQLQELQQTFRPVKDAPTCENCARASRNPNHNHKNCAFAVCRNCKLGGHRLLVCPSLGTPNAPGGGNGTAPGGGKGTGGGGGGTWQPAVSQQTFQPVQGGPGPTCDTCTRASRNPNHHHAHCPFISCRKCKQGGHRAKVCPARNTVSAPGGGNGAGRGGKTRQPEVPQQTSQPVQGDPGLTCVNCTRHSRDPNHNYKQCPFLVCRKCKLGGHRANVCPTRSDLSAPGSGNGTGGGRST